LDPWQRTSVLRQQMWEAALFPGQLVRLPTFIYRV
jgi:hypothetical protein